MSFIQVDAVRTVAPGNARDTFGFLCPSCDAAVPFNTLHKCPKDGNDYQLNTEPPHFADGTDEAVEWDRAPDVSDDAILRAYDGR